MRNRLGNSLNPYQGTRKKALCVCTAGLLRSPTVAWVLSNEPFGLNTRAVGTDSDFALIPIDAVHVHWADIIFCMNIKQSQIISSIMDTLPNSAIKKEHCPIIVLDIPDSFEFRDEKLVDLLIPRLTDIFEVLEKDGKKFLS